MGRTSAAIKRQGFSPGIFRIGGILPELGIYIDESGIQEGGSRYYLITMVMHELDVDLNPFYEAYEHSLHDRGLPDIPFHSSPLLRGYGDYLNMDAKTRNRLLVSFGAFVRRLPVSYATFSYRSSEFDGQQQLTSLIEKDIANFLGDNLAYFQHFGSVKVFYDNGQEAVTDAVHDAFEKVLFKGTTDYLYAEYRSSRLSQVADYLCALELTALKYDRHEETETDRRFFGMKGNFKKNYLKRVRNKALV